MLLLAIMSISSVAASHAREVKLASGPSRTHLLELYTSEGCSSCPPAEAWLSKLKDDPRLWSEFVPVAFHVDYWDRLGWRDPFASRQWTARQYQYSALWKSSSVYTPGFVLNGREWRNSGVPAASTEKPGVLGISVLDDKTVTATFQPAERRYNTAVPLDLHVARLGFDLRSNVKAGENSGRKLLHDFVVLSLVRAEMSDGKGELRVPVIAGKEAGGRSAIVAWVTEPGGLEPVQAVGGWNGGIIPPLR